MFGGPISRWSCKRGLDVTVFDSLIASGWYGLVSKNPLNLRLLLPFHVAFLFLRLDPLIRILEDGKVWLEHANRTSQFAVDHLQVSQAVQCFDHLLGPLLLATEVFRSVTRGVLMPRRT
jgi:hypothetical protein